VERDTLLREQDLERRGADCGAAFRCDLIRVSYGSDVTDAYRVAYIPAGFSRAIKPSDLPVQQASKVQLYINLKTAKALGTVPEPLLGRADEA
jgi:hypothetical protein